MTQRQPTVTAEDLDALVDEITQDAVGEDEARWAFQCAFEESAELPADATVIGEPVEVTSIDYDGNERRGIVARCVRNEIEHTVALADVAFPENTEAALHLSAYRRWLGLPPQTIPRACGSRRSRRPPGQPRHEEDDPIRR